MGRALAAYTQRMIRASLAVLLAAVVLGGCGGGGAASRTSGCGHGCNATLRGSKAAEIRAARDSNASLFRIFPSRVGTAACAIPTGRLTAVELRATCQTSVTYPATRGRYAEAFVRYRERWGRDHSASWTLIVQWPAEKVVATQLHGDVSPQMQFAALYAPAASLPADLRITKNVPCPNGHVTLAGPDAVSRFHAVTAVMCGGGTRIYNGAQWYVSVREVAVGSVASLQRYFEQHSSTTRPKGACLAYLDGVAVPIFVDSAGHWLVPQTPRDACGHVLGSPGSVRWHVVAVHKLRLMISAPALATGCDMGMGRPAEHSWTPAAFSGVHPWTVRVCVYRTSARHQWVGSFVRGARLDRSQTKRLLAALKGPAPHTSCTMTTEFAEVIARHPGVSAGVEIGGCYRVNGGVGTADPAVLRSILGAGY